MPNLPALKRPSIPDRVTAGMEQFDFLLRGHWYLHTDLDTDGQPPGISQIIHAMRCHSDGRMLFLGRNLHHHPNLGMVPYPDEDPGRVGRELDAEWQLQIAIRRADHELGQRIYRAFLGGFRSAGLDPNYTARLERVERKQLAA